MGAFCSCFNVQDAEVSPSSFSCEDSNTRNHQNQHANPRIVSFFHRASLIINPWILEVEPVQLPEAADNSSSTPTHSIQLPQGITWDSAAPDSDPSEECPTCFDTYTDENPKIIGECSHHFHLQCILEWQQRSEECPNCRRVLIVKELFG